MSRTEDSLTKAELGHDRRQVEALLQVHAGLKAERLAWEERVEALAAKALSFADEDYLDDADCAGRIGQVCERFQDLQELLTQRENNLQASLELQRFLAAVKAQGNLSFGSTGEGEATGMELGILSVFPSFLFLNQK